MDTSRSMDMLEFELSFGGVLFMYCLSVSLLLPLNSSRQGRVLPVLRVLSFTSDRLDMMKAPNNISDGNISLSLRK